MSHGDQSSINKSIINQSVAADFGEGRGRDVFKKNKKHVNIRQARSFFVLHNCIMTVDVRSHKGYSSANNLK